MEFFIVMYKKTHYLKTNTMRTFLFLFMIVVFNNTACALLRVSTDVPVSKKAQRILSESEIASLCMFASDTIDKGEKEIVLKTMDLFPRTDSVQKVHVYGIRNEREITDVVEVAIGPKEIRTSYWYLWLCIGTCFLIILVKYSWNTTDDLIFQEPIQLASVALLIGILVWNILSLVYLLREYEIIERQAFASFILFNILLPNAVYYVMKTYFDEEPIPSWA